MPFILLLLFTELKSQSVSGVWQGILTQNEKKGALSSSYAYWLEIETRGDSVIGRTRIEVANTEKYGIVLIKGRVGDDVVNFTGYEIKEGNVEQFGVKWCLIVAMLRYNESDQTLRGVWYGNNACGNGDITLYRSNNQFNDNASQINEYISLEELSRDIKDSETISRKKVVVENIYFASNSADLNNEAREILDNLSELLQKNKEIKISILGHTDNVGEISDNLKLSVDRAESVYEYLVSKGISKDRLRYEGYGESRPIEDNSTENGRSRNRRIELEIR